MQMLHNLKVSAKLNILIGILSILMCVVSVMGYIFLRQSDDRFMEMYERQLLPVQWIVESRNQFRGIDSDIFELMLASDEKRKQLLIQDMQRREDLLHQNLTNFEKNNLDDYEQAKWQELNASLKAVREARKGMMDLIQQGKGAEGYAYYVQHVAGSAEQFQLILRDLSNHSIEGAENLDKKSDKEFAFAVNLLLGITLAAILIGMIAGILISRMITRPLKVIVDTSREVAAGNLADVNMEISSKDEIGQLTQEFNIMTQSLRQLIKKVAETSEQVAASSEQLTASADESARATNQVAGSVNEVAADAQKQVAALEETAAVIEQMAAGMQQVAANSNTAAAQTSQTAQTAEAGSAIIENAVTKMAGIEKTVIDSAGIVAKLGERSGQIGQIVDTISGLAAQTNLLALNAAIEAARAGEQGRGFAVVAEEVRKLAEQSQEAAKRIAALISEVQAETSQAVQAMTNGTSEVKLGADTINQAGNSFRDIVSLVQHVSLQVRDISAAIQQMAGSSQSIVASVREADRIGRNTASQTQTVSAATEEQSASIEEIAAASQSLAKMAEEMQAAIRVFKI